MMYVASSSEPLPSLFKLCFWRPKLALPQRSRVLLKSYTPRSAAQDSNCFHAHDELILIFLNHVDPDQLSPMEPADQNPQCFHPHNESIDWTGWKSKHIHNLKRYCKNPTHHT